MGYTPQIIPQRNHAYIESGVHSKSLYLVDDSANHEYKHALALVILNQRQRFLVGGSRSDDNCKSGDIAGYQRQTQFTNLCIGAVTPQRIMSIGIFILNIFTCFDYLCCTGSSDTGSEDVMRLLATAHLTLDPVHNAL